MTPIRLFEIQGMKYVDNEWETSGATHTEASLGLLLVIVVKFIWILFC